MEIGFASLIHNPTEEGLVSRLGGDTSGHNEAHHQDERGHDQTAGFQRSQHLSSIGIEC